MVESSQRPERPRVAALGRLEARGGAHTREVDDAYLGGAARLVVHEQRRGTQRYSEAIEATSRNKWYSEELFARFSVREVRGEISS